MPEELPVLVFSDSMFLHCVTFDSRTAKGSASHLVSIDFEVAGLKWLNRNILIVLSKNETMLLCQFDLGLLQKVVSLQNMQLLYNVPIGPSESNPVARIAYEQTIDTTTNLAFFLCLGKFVVGSISDWKVKLRDIRGRFGLTTSLTFLSHIYANASSFFASLAEQDFAQVQEEAMSLVADMDMDGKGPFLMNCLLQLDLDDFFYTQLFPCLKTSDKRTVFEKIHEMMNQGSLASVPEEIVQQMVEESATRANLEKLEESLIMYNMGRPTENGIDLHFYISTAKKYEMYQLLIYLYCERLKDYVTPIEELSQSLASGNPKGYVLFAFLSSSLSGVSFSTGRSLDLKYQSDILHTLFYLPPEYPNLRTLILFDILEFFRLFKVVFEKASLNDEIPLFADYDPQELHMKRAATASFHAEYISRQFILDRLYELFRGEEFTWSDKTAFFKFFTEMISSYPTFLCYSNDDLLQAARESIKVVRNGELNDNCDFVVDLLGKLEDLNRERLHEFVRLLQGSTISRVQEFLFNRLGDYRASLDCVLQDPSRLHMIFDLWMSVSNPDVRNEFFLAEFIKLMEIDARKCSEIVSSNFAGQMMSFCVRLKRPMQFELLNFAYEAHSLLASDAAWSNYVYLCCEYRPSLVMELLEQMNSLPFSELLEVCLKFKVTDAVLFLYEKSGDHKNAFEFLIGDLQPIDEEKLDRIVGFCCRYIREDYWQRVVSSVQGPSLERLVDSLPYQSVRENLENLPRMAEILASVVAKYRYELTSHQTMVRILDKDKMREEMEIQQAARKGTAPNPECSKCLQEMHFRKATVVFPCGHVSHEGCLFGQSDCPQCFGDRTHQEICLDDQLSSPVCRMELFHSSV